MKLILTCLLLALSSGFAVAQVTAGRSLGQSLYLPVYSHIWHRVVSAQYYDTDGKKLRKYVPTAQAIPPMGTLELFVPRSDDTGGSGANFVIQWKSDTPASPPMVEGIHANLPAGRSIAFISSARALPDE